MSAADKQEWIEYEANVRCPTVAGRGRVGIGRARKDLAREWGEMVLAGRTLCIEALREGLLQDQRRLAFAGPAQARLQEAVAFRAAADYNLNAEAYFAVCRAANRQHQDWFISCGRARNSWRNLRAQYGWVPLAARSAGQIASIAVAQSRENDANTQSMIAAAGTASTNTWLRTSPIYKTPIPNTKIRETDVPRERRLKPGPDTSLARNFTRDGLVAGTWRSVAGKPLYQREGVNVRVWFQIDDQGNITDRIVRKEQTVDNFYDFRVFKGRLPWELECHRLMTRSQGNRRLKSIVPLRRTHPPALRRWVDRDRKCYKVYMAWCPYGNLTALIEAQRQIPQIAGQLVPFPEPMIWSVAESLIRSGRLMVDLAANNGEQMVHRDLKPSNIVLGEASPDNYPDYPEMLVTDFGQAFTTSVDDDRNPDWWNSAATIGFRPPELDRYVDPTTLLPVSADKILEHTNVWQAGAVLRSLVLLESRPIQSLFLDGANDATYRVNVQGTPAVANYSDALLQMIDDMMAFAWNARPTFQDLADRIRHLPDVSQGMRDATATAQQRTSFGVAVIVDKYSVGMAPPPPPPPAALPPP